MWGEQQYLKVFNDVVESEPIKQRRSQGSIIEMVTVGRRWVIDDSRESIAWGVSDDNRGEPPQYYSRSYDGLPPLWRTIDGSVQPNFIYINEINRDIVSKEDDVRSTWVTHDLGDNLFSVEVRQGRGIGKQSRRFASRPTGSFIVYIDDPRRTIKDGYLGGEYILWQDDKIVAPSEAVGTTYRYLPISELRLTQEELAEAVYQGDAELVTWDYKRDGRFWKWTRRVHPLQYLDPVALQKRREAIQKRREAAEKRAEQQSQRPGSKPTHLLILSGNRFHYGQLISETDSEIRFLVIDGSIAAETVFAKDQVVTLKEIPPLATGPVEQTTQES